MDPKSYSSVPGKFGTCFKKIGETTQGVNGIYFTSHPDLTGGKFMKFGTLLKKAVKNSQD